MGVAQLPYPQQKSNQQLFTDKNIFINTPELLESERLRHPLGPHNWKKPHSRGKWNRGMVSLSPHHHSPKRCHTSSQHSTTHRRFPWAQSFYGGKRELEANIQLPQHSGTLSRKPTHYYLPGNTGSTGRARPPRISQKQRTKVRLTETSTWILQWLCILANGGTPPEKLAHSISTVLQEV